MTLNYNMTYNMTYIKCKRIFYLLLYKIRTMNKKEELDIVSVIIAIMSLIVFLYRFILLAIPMFTDGIKTGNYKNIALSMTMLV